MEKITTRNHQIWINTTGLPEGEKKEVVVVPNGFETPIRVSFTLNKSGTVTLMARDQFHDVSIVHFENVEVLETVLAQLKRQS